MTNIKQRAHELLTCDELRGRLPDEVRAFLRDVVALEPVCCIPTHAIENLPLKYWKVFETNLKEPGDSYVYTLGAPNDPA